jgi:alkanesulfonate monooxygenase SsuD/methylene tetrahydromethanopterin reductase-like flavin-dependent oxidoreductase (luciferase family)
MKFGIFYEHQIGRPWDDSTEHQLIQNALTQVEFADKLGIQYVWEVEHHFLEEYTIPPRPRCSSRPAASAQRTCASATASS